MDYVSLPISASSRINNLLPVLNMSLDRGAGNRRARTSVFTVTGSLNEPIEPPMTPSRFVRLAGFALLDSARSTRNALVVSVGWCTQIAGNADFGLCANLRTSFSHRISYLRWFRRMEKSYRVEVSSFGCRYAVAASVSDRVGRILLWQVATMQFDCKDWFVYDI